MGGRKRHVLTVMGIMTVGYAVLVLGFVATSPDVGLRFLLIDRDSTGSVGIEVRDLCLSDGDYKGRVELERGDLVLRLRGVPIRSFLDFTTELHKLYNAPIPPGGQLDPWVDPKEVTSALPPLVQVGDESRWIKVVFRKKETAVVHAGWLRVQSLPFGDVSLTFVWFLAELLIFSVGVVAYWHRPFDEPARLFLAMCIVTMGAFVPGFHWWVVAGSQWLCIPFVVLAVMVPPVTLHFFLVYPHRKTLLSQHPTLTGVLLYSLPACAIVAMLAAVVRAYWLNGNPDAGPQVVSALLILWHAIYSYLAISGAFFLLILAALIRAFFTTRNPIERHQVKWILWAGMLATIPLGYTLYLSLADRVGFALGRAQWPMFLASLSFMIAYAIGIVRYKLILTDEVVGKGVLYYMVSFGVTIGCGIVIGLGTIAPQVLSISMAHSQKFVLFAILVLAVVFLFWLRDRFQRLIDQRFFREKYQLGKALQQMNRAAGNLLDREAMAELLLSSCREVLHAGRAALYVNTGTRSTFQLVGVQGTDDCEFQVRLGAEFIEQLRQDGTLQRVTTANRVDMTSVQSTLHNLRADVVHALEMEGEISALVLLGEKRNSAVFTAEDLTFLNAMGQITNVALRSAKVNQDMTRLNEEMHDKVQRISEQRRQITLLQSELATVKQDDQAPSAEAMDAAVFEREAVKGDSPAMQQVLSTIRKVAPAESSVLIRGESGTGKEILAKVIHDNSGRSNGPLVRVHCAALSATLLESELFGHAKGAFTGAHRDKIGRFEAAHGGTLFLDEIGDISLDTQIKLLRVLQERCFEPVGGSRTVHVDVRLLTATHQDLEQLIIDGRFREDLFYRLNVISVTLPPLRDRVGDLLELTLHFMKQSAERAGKRITHIDERALQAVEQYSWPGNVRELENAIERAVVMAEEDHITLSDLPADITRFKTRERPAASATRSANTAAAAAARTTGQAAIQDAERAMLIRALENCDGNKARAARELGLPRSTYFSKLKKFGIT